MSQSILSVPTRHQGPLLGAIFPLSFLFSVTLNRKIYGILQITNVLQNFVAQNVRFFIIAFTENKAEECDLDEKSTLLWIVKKAIKVFGKLCKEYEDNVSLLAQRQYQYPYKMTRLNQKLFFSSGSTRTIRKFLENVRSTDSCMGNK